MQQEQTEKVKYLDQMIPLNGASHADVVSYGVDTPMRYSECFAKLADGRVVRLKDSRQFIGWSGMNGSRRLLFRSDAGRILIPASVSHQQAVSERGSSGMHKFITRDGGLLFVQRLGQDIARHVGLADGVAA
jgi:hypothetical protein